jgi:7-carboxy-7-deazaguanine synthase
VLRLSELYTSVQGEGPNTGLPTQFVRFAGCNMRCPGWPCDTQFAIEPSLYMAKNEQGVVIGSEKLDADVLVRRLPEWPKHLCLTGGEPFMQKHVDLQEFCEFAWERGYTIEVFTNGSFAFPPWAIGGLRIMMDWKLEGSGEEYTGLEERLRNAQRLHVRDGIKFVVKGFRDLQQAHGVYEGIKEKDVAAQFWVGSAWGTISDAEIVEYMMEHRLPWRLNIQTHKVIWPAEARGV